MLPCNTDLEKDATGATAGRGKFLESGVILGGNHGKLSYFPGFTKQTLGVWENSSFPLFPQNMNVLSQNDAVLVYAFLGKFSLAGAGRGKFLTYSKSDPDIVQPQTLCHTAPYWPLYK